MGLKFPMNVVIEAMLIRMILTPVEVACYTNKYIYIYIYIDDRLEGSVLDRTVNGT
jgi:hypothetical protein